MHTVSGSAAVAGMVSGGAAFGGGVAGSSASRSSASVHVVPTDLISSWWTVVVLAVLAGGAVTFAVVRRVRHRRATRAAQGAGAPTAARPHARRPRSWHLVLAGVGALLLAIGVGVNTWVGYLPTVDSLAIHLGLGPRLEVPPVRTGPVPGATVATVAADPADLPTGTGAFGSVRIDAPADLSVDPSDTWVYTPPGFDDSGETLYPVVVMIHGSPGGSADWFGAGLPAVLDSLITSGAVRPMIVVAPDMNGRDQSEVTCVDSTRGGSQVETYLRDVVMPWVDDHYPVATGREYQAIGGMSAGAYCALDQGLRHSADTGTILAIMPYGNPGDAQGAGLSTADEVAAHSPSDYVDTVDLTDPTAVFLDYGTSEPDPEVPATAEDLAERLEARGQPVGLRTEPGLGHSWTTATTALPYALEFFEQQMVAAETAR
ncbi:enterochelin esterase-like enzyme [Sanguibacter keddieii DSM 10542]|uniref:Enterochelin esterase-like enzyme n=1 Tax=Sanguibacter keddieii (strain ATCC 51767 / DSM 10542 / NCFB 3025 / ST-74) TaxID=446469 RepID=D1BGI7_SANKS|nr:alpha/beta hydrolase-fold protein [Sanguibacter keddieii]ACZ21564.1 enterochelin esterase-like enzyme [Sanguibacter keddieii DSM 10542]